MTSLHKFLLIDDVPENRFLVSKALLQKYPGSLVQECEESTPAIAAVQHDRHSAIIVHRGRDVDGPTLVALLRRVNATVPIVMVSGRESCPAAIEAGANAFLNYEGWRRIGDVVENTLSAEQGRARASKFPFITVPKKDASAPNADEKPRILYLEDDPADVELLRETLSAEKIAAEVEHVCTPKEFADALQRTSPSLVLADGNVAGFVTTAALSRVRQQWPAVPFYCLSGVVSDEKLAALRAGGADGCLSKQDLPAVSKIVRRTIAGGS